MVKDGKTRVEIYGKKINFIKIIGIFQIPRGTRLKK